MNRTCGFLNPVMGSKDRKLLDKPKIEIGSRRSCMNLLIRAQALPFKCWVEYEIINFCLKTNINSIWFNLARGLCLAFIYKVYRNYAQS